MGAKRIMATMHPRPRRVLLLVDGNALVHRAFHALPTLTTSQSGEMVNAVYGFANTLFKVVSVLKPSHWAIAFDFPAPTFRHALYDKYKAQRPPTPEELKGQIRRVHELAEVLGMPSFELEGYEADDILGTLASQAREKGIDAAILTGDRDLLQMVGPGITVLLPGRNFSEAVTYDDAAVEARFGVKPAQLIDYKALVGDPSDNIPGVPGIGDKTAANLLITWGSLDSVFEHIDEVTPQRVRALLAASQDQAQTGKKLATIVRDAPLQLSLDDCVIGKYDRNRVLALLKELEFNSLANRLPEMRVGDEAAEALEAPAELVPIPAVSAAAVISPELAATLAVELKGAREIVLCPVPKASGPAPARLPRSPAAPGATLCGLGVSTREGELVYIPTRTPAGNTSEQEHREQLRELLSPIFQRGDCLRVCDDVKTVLRYLSFLDMQTSGSWFDVSVAAHLAGDKAVNLAALALNRLGVTLREPQAGTDRLSVASDQDIAESLSSRAAACWALRVQLGTEMTRRGVLDLFNSVEMPLIPVLADMENTGILVDAQKLREMSRTLGEQLAALEIDIYNAVGHRFNINSPKQLGNVLYNELGLPTGRKSGTGHTTDAAQLEFLRAAHPVIALVLQFRQLSKLKSTYVDTLPDLINPATGRIHTVFSQTTAATGRLSSSDPNLQNLPIRTELGRTIRAAVIAPKGWTLLSADYSQIDLRVLAHLSQDEVLKSAFLNDEDIHTATASRIFGVAPGEVNGEMRRAAKVVNFGVIYGMSEYGLEQATDLSRVEAGKFIKAYFEQYPGVQQWLDRTKAQARRDLYVTTLLGRRRYLPEILSTNRQVRESAERMAINAPVQGTSADIIKVAMIHIHEETRRRKMRSRMLLQIHDELLFESPESELPELSEVVRGLMPNAVRLTVPLKVDLKSGPNWADMKPVPG